MIRRPQYRSRMTPEERANSSGGMLGGTGSSARVKPGGLAGGGESMEVLDTDGNGRLSADERKEAFKHFDKNGDGRLDRREVADTLKADGVEAKAGMIADIYQKLRGLSKAGQQGIGVRSHDSEGHEQTGKPSLNPIGDAMLKRRNKKAIEEGREPEEPKVRGDHPVRRSDTPGSERARRENSDAAEQDEPAKPMRRFGSPKQTPDAPEAEEPKSKPMRRFGSRKEAPDAPEPEERSSRSHSSAGHHDTSTKLEKAAKTVMLMDRDGDGHITGTEFRKGAARMMGGLRGALRTMDLNNDGAVTMDEVAKINTEIQRQGQENGTNAQGIQLKQANLGSYDLNGDGLLDKAEATAMLKTLDTNHDGKVTMAEALAGKTGMNIKELGGALLAAGIKFEPDTKTTAAAIIPKDTPDMVASAAKNDKGEGSTR